MAPKTAYERMQLIKNIHRPSVEQYVSALVEDFIEFHGDRTFGDDAAIYGGIGLLDGRAVTVVGHRKGHSTEENIRYNFGMAHPEGYRKAMRLFDQAEKFGRPVLLFVDTPGAFCGVGAEERGQGEAIARSIQKLMFLKVPVLTVITGEGGSGGALGLAVADRVYMLENAVYSVISPRGFASILWKDPSKEEQAAELLKMTAPDLLGFGIIDGIIPEPKGGAHTDPAKTCIAVKEVLVRELEVLCTQNTRTLLDNRYQKYRSMGVYGG